MKEYYVILQKSEVKGFIRNMKGALQKVNPFRRKTSKEQMTDSKNAHTAWLKRRQTALPEEVDGVSLYRRGASERAVSDFLMNKYGFTPKYSDIAAQEIYNVWRKKG